MMKMTMNNINNSPDYKIALEYLICKKYKLGIPQYIKSEEASVKYSEYRQSLEELIPLIFDDIGILPIKFVAYSKESDSNGNLITSPHDFILENEKTLSIRTSKAKSSSCKIAPRVIGQAGYNVLNSYFGKIYGKTIETQQDLKELFFFKADSVLPIFLEKTFISDYSVFVQLNDEPRFTIVEKARIRPVSFEPDDIEYTRDLDEWTESNSIKYRGITIAEVQTHKYRTFKFRFLLNNILQFVYDMN